MRKLTFSVDVKLNAETFHLFSIFISYLWL